MPERPDPYSRAQDDCSLACANAAEDEMRAHISAHTARLLKAGVVTVPGEAFGTREHVRVSYPTTPALLDKGLQRMKEFN